MGRESSPSRSAILTAGRRRCRHSGRRLAVNGDEQLDLRLELAETYEEMGLDREAILQYEALFDQFLIRGQRLRSRIHASTRRWSGWFGSFAGREMRRGFG
jgi:hypothetical protein